MSFPRTHSWSLPSLELGDFRMQAFCLFFICWDPEGIPSWGEHLYLLLWPKSRHQPRTIWPLWESQFNTGFSSSAYLHCYWPGDQYLIYYSTVGIRPQGKLALPIYSKFWADLFYIKRVPHNNTVYHISGSSNLYEIFIVMLWGAMSDCIKSQWV